MKKHYLYISFFLFGAVAYAQIGIKTEDPKATLDIKASNQATPANTDGILFPRIDNFPVTNPLPTQKGMAVYVTGNGIPNEGFYYWNGGAWVSFSESASANQNKRIRPQ